MATDIVSAAASSGIGAEPQDPEVPSCLGCRRRKLRCSRDQPTCSHCQRLGISCAYNLKRTKPGMKPGAIEGLNRRVGALESALLELSAKVDSQQQGSSAIPASDAHIPPHNDQDEDEHDTTWEDPQDSFLPPAEPPTPPTASGASAQSAITFSDPSATASYSYPRKRRRVDSCGNPNIDVVPSLGDVERIGADLPPPEMLEEVITAHFIKVQPWLPLLHETQFRKNLCDHVQRKRLLVVLYAMVYASLRWIDGCDSRLRREDMEQWETRCRNAVLLTAMDRLSVENLQALSIVAFIDIGNGDISRAWSIIGSLTRTVEYLQLSVESDQQDKAPLLMPLLSIDPAKDWTEEEERRRVFWNIFNLDRFCSVTTGWNTSLTSDDVRRRLPADGGLWHRGESVTTPYFGIWDRSAARIGNSITFLPAHYPSPEQTTDACPETPKVANTSNGDSSVDMTTVGAFAYCIEATESLSRVTTYFLQQKINFQDRQEVGNWLTRFKELDLRLVHWKMFLPQKWKDSNISRQPALINMDPNLTLAHITHNTSMILLHQQIAYPQSRWTGIVRLPSSCSAETCQVAAVETANITQKYLKYTPESGPLHNQFAFCVFITARVLLIHWRYYNGNLAPEFWLLVTSLDEMAKRWAGPLQKHDLSTTLSGRYSSRLRYLHRKCEADPEISKEILEYAGGMSEKDIGAQHSTSAIIHHATDPVPRQEVVPSSSSARHMDTTPPETISHLHHQLQGSISAIGQPHPVALPAFTPPTHDSPDELSTISRILMDQQFMHLDRVISFEDMMFTAQTREGTAQNGWMDPAGMVDN